MNTVFQAKKMLLAATSGTGNVVRREIFNSALDSFNSNPKHQYSQETEQFNRMQKEIRAKIVADAVAASFPKLQEHHLLGMLGNLMEESNLQTAICNSGTAFQKVYKGSGAIGLAQWLSVDRYTNFLNSATSLAQEKKMSDDLLIILHPVAQIRSLVSELKTIEANSFAKFVTAKNINEAATYWMKYIERPGNVSSSGRVQAANSLKSIF